MREHISMYVTPVSGITSYFQLIDLAHEYGIRYVDFLNHYELLQPDPTQAAAIRRYLDERNMQACCLTMGLSLVGDETARADSIARAKQYVDIAEILGAPFFHHTIAPGLNDAAYMRENHDRIFAQGVAGVQEIFDYAAAKSIRTVFENQGFLFNGTANMTAFLQQAQRHIGLVGDIGNILFVDEHAVDYLPAVMPAVVHMHIKDYIYTDGSTRTPQEGEFITAAGNYLLDCPFGEGCVDFDRVFAILKEGGYNGLFSLECPPIPPDDRAVFERNLAYLDRYE